MPHTRSEDIGNIAAGALKIGAGFFRAKPSEETISRGVATAGTASRISPTLRDRVSGAFGATRGVQAFEAGRATIEGQEALTKEREARAGAIEGEAQASTQSFRLTNFLSPKLTTKLTQALIDVGADVDGNGIITDVELNKGISKIDTKFLSDGITEGISDLQSQIDIVQTSDGGINKLIEKANASMLASGQTVSEADFRTNPELANTFPKIAQSIARKDQINKQIGQFKRAEEGVKGMVGQQETVGQQPTRIKEFETITGVDTSLRGTPEYEKAFFDFQTKIREKTQGRKQLVGTTPEGAIVIFDNITGKIETSDVVTEILPKNKKLLSGEIAGQLATFDSLIDQIDDIKVIAKNNPEFIGPVAGQWNKLKSRFVDNADFTELDRNVESLITIAYALSGKQISEREMRMLKGAILPSVTQPGANFDTALDFASKWLTSNRDNRIKRLRQTGFFVGGDKETTKTKTGLPKLPRTDTGRTPEQEAASFLGEE
ncbi:hypothetical protein LCGC14_1323510 [marine sediment metagenome]|uniref:EF-hand domain-containing protein n=1 Tax=marine sediment metagenome TaxID=412755 RepID=A0A0F9KJA7_9ZZZZ